MSAIAARIAEARERISSACARAGRSPDDVTIIAVTKGFGPDAVREAVAAGLRDIGENRVQEAAAKRATLSDLPTGVRWHMIGHLQTNKVQTMLGLFDTIHSVDSIHLAQAISRRAQAPVPAFLEVNVAAEATKTGFSLAELPAAHRTIATLPNIQLRGLMTVAPIAASPEDVRPVFRELARQAKELGLGELSMGMSDDYEVAVEEGATYVRLGRALFGERQ
ncbi:MAG TPA: YggS family pyridoxal phosphate-dependent enzyme [Dehalococcoidia bacterium]|jgi:pyridoxal phosphate enzyme (YggS family)|nr:YggS family pyridoxal phosphate-dependent enzyme [Dehalococcoidia bacterium]